MQVSNFEEHSMINLSDGDGSILKTALKDAIAFQLRIQEHKVRPWTGDQSEKFMDAVAAAEMYARILSKLKRRMHAKR